MSRLEWIKKIIMIVVGSVVAAYGITLALYAGFGGATLAVLWQGISETFHVSIGMASMIVAIIMITFALIILVTILCCLPIKLISSKDLSEE